MTGAREMLFGRDFPAEMAKIWDSNPDMERTAQDVVMDALRKEVRWLLTLCTKEQQAFFLRLYPGGIENMDENNLRNAFGQCIRTIKKNGEPRP